MFNKNDKCIELWINNRIWHAVVLFVYPFRYVKCFVVRLSRGLWLTSAWGQTGPGTIPHSEYQCQMVGLEPILFRSVSESVFDSIFIIYLFLFFFFFLSLYLAISQLDYEQMCWELLGGQSKKSPSRLLHSVDHVNQDLGSVSF